MKYCKPDVKQLIILLRFGASKIRDTKYRCLTYAAISRLIGRSATFIRNCCLEFQKDHEQKGSKYHVVTRRANNNVT